ncbi:hypothetical protein J6590_100909 [Homalodisca vitripennis]|nr:hypothetical protein J6590_100909 [Homalodisca vitripennis]
MLQAFEARSFAQVTFCDLSKAFDSVDHSDLLSKLHFYGFQGKSPKDLSPVILLAMKLVHEQPESSAQVPCERP